MMAKTGKEILYIFLSILTITMGIVTESGAIVALSSLAFNICITYKVRKNQLLLFISVFMGMYTIPPILYFLFHITLSAYTTFNSYDNYFFTILVQSIFLLVFSIGLNDSIFRPDDKLLQFRLYDSSIAFCFCVVGIIVTTLFGKSGESIFAIGGYKSVSAGSALFEYCYIFYFLAYIVSGERSNRRRILYILFIFYTIRGIMYGARIEILAMLILFYICFYRNRFKSRTVIILAFIVWIMFSAFGLFREGLNLELNGLLKLYGYNTTYNRIVNNESEVFYTSTVLLSAIRSGFLDSTYRIKAFLYYLIRLFIPSSLVDNTYNIVPFLQNNFSSCGGGGFFSVFMYAYGGWVGVGIGAILCAILWNKIGKITAQKSTWQILILMSVIMTPRWYVYSPEAIIKIPLYTTVGFIILRLFLGLKNQKDVFPGFGDSISNLRR